MFAPAVERSNLTGLLDLSVCRQCLPWVQSLQFQSLVVSFLRPVPHFLVSSYLYVGKACASSCQAWRYQLPSIKRRGQQATCGESAKNKRVLHDSTA